MGGITIEEADNFKKVAIEGLQALNLFDEQLINNLQKYLDALKDQAGTQLTKPIESIESRINSINLNISLYNRYIQELKNINPEYRIVTVYTRIVPNG